MSGTAMTKSSADHEAAAAEVPIDPVQSIRVLAAENAALVRRLRSAQIPQHVGMAAACRALAVELPRALAAQLDADLKSGVLAQRWEAVRAAAAEPGASGEIDSTLTALALLLREQSRTAMRHLVLREKEWAADAYRLEGQAGALEAVVERLQRVADRAPASDTAAPISDAEAQVVAEVEPDPATVRAAIWR